MYEDYKVTVPEGISGNWEVQKFEISQKDEEFEKLRAAISFSSRGRYVPAGNYTRLMGYGKVVMSDTPDEIADHQEPIFRAKGYCLVNGLGLGVVLQGMLRKPSVTKVIVIEKSPDVIKLVAPHYYQMFGQEKLEIIQNDAFNYQPIKGVRFNVVWHDIWTYSSIDLRSEKNQLKKKYRQICDWQSCWGY